MQSDLESVVSVLTQIVPTIQSQSIKDSYRLGLKYCLFNARSLTNKLSTFQSYVYSNRLNIYCITETWLTCNGIFNNEILPTGYTIFRKDRDTHGGGVLIASTDLSFDEETFDPHALLCRHVEAAL